MGLLLEAVALVAGIILVILHGLLQAVQKAFRWYLDELRKDILQSLGGCDCQH